MKHNLFTVMAVVAMGMIAGFAGSARGESMPSMEMLPAPLAPALPESNPNTYVPAQVDEFDGAVADSVQVSCRLISLQRLTTSGIRVFNYAQRVVKGDCPINYGPGYIGIKVPKNYVDVSSLPKDYDYYRADIDSVRCETLYDETGYARTVMKYLHWELPNSLTFGCVDSIARPMIPGLFGQSYQGSGQDIKVPILGR